METLGDQGLRPALAEALNWRIRLLDSRTQPDEVLTAERENLTARLDRLESEMEIHTGRASPVLLLM